MGAGLVVAGQLPQDLGKTRRGGTSGLPRLKSSTLSAPYFAFILAPSSNIFRIQDDLVANSCIFRATVITHFLSAYFSEAA